MSENFDKFFHQIRDVRLIKCSKIIELRFFFLIIKGFMEMKGKPTDRPNAEMLNSIDP